MVEISVIEFSTFEDLVYFLHTRITTVNPYTSALCSDKMCFTMISAGESVLFVLRSPPPPRSARFVYIAEDGKLRYSETPVVGKPMVVVVRVSGMKRVQGLDEALG